MYLNAEPSDATLTERLQAGDLNALGTLFSRYSRQIFRTAIAITQDKDIAEDITQDCFLRLHRYAHRIDTNLPLAPWLYRVTVNLSYTWITRYYKRRVPLDSIVEDMIGPQRYTPDYHIEITGMQDDVRKAIASLGFNQQVVVVLHYLNGLHLEDIALTLDCPVGTVKSRLYYARENLRQHLQNTHEEHALYSSTR